MNHSLKVGLSFGITSGIITTLGLMIGLAEAASSRLVVIGGILTIAIADAFSDALGIHISEESENKHSEKEIWTSTLTAWCAKFVFALTFLVPVVLLPLQRAILVSIFWGMLLLGVVSWRVARQRKTPTWKAVGEHLLTAALVIVLTHLAGDWIGAMFGE